MRHLLDYLTPNLNVHVYYSDAEHIEHLNIDVLDENVIILARENVNIPSDIIDRFGEPEVVNTKIRGREFTFMRIIN